MRMVLDLREYAERLYERRHEAVVIPFVEGEADDWRPQPKQCHDNVTRVVLENDGYTAIRGWLFIDCRPSGSPHVRFLAHSVIETPDGRVLDITPTPVPQKHPFIRHNGTE